MKVIQENKEIVLSSPVKEFLKQGPYTITY